MNDTTVNIIRSHLEYCHRDKESLERIIDESERLLCREKEKLRVLSVKIAQLEEDLKCPK